MNRRSFLNLGLKAILAAGVAPAVVAASSLMRVKPVLVMKYRQPGLSTAQGNIVYPWAIQPDLYLYGLPIYFDHYCDSDVLYLVSDSYGIAHPSLDHSLVRVI